MFKDMQKISAHAIRSFVILYATTLNKSHFKPESKIIYFNISIKNEFIFLLIKIIKIKKKKNSVFRIKQRLRLNFTQDFKKINQQKSELIKHKHK
jgi:hypothetical protein